MEISKQLRCLFSANIENQDESYIVEVPKQEIQLGDLQEGETYRVAVLPSPVTAEADDTDAKDTDADTQPERARQTPPVEEGEHRTVEIENIGEQGDGITRVERGFVVIVSDTSPGERVTVEINHVRENVAFADVVGRPAGFE